MASSVESLTKRDHCDVAIIGAGLAGSLSAIHLARAGFRVVLFEKDMKFTERVCGEFLSFESLPLLREVGIDPIKLGGLELTEFRLHGPTSSADLRLPRRAVGISRASLDEELLRIAVEAGAIVRRGVVVTELLEGLDETTGSILLSTSAGETRCQRLIVASGKTDFPSLGARTARDSSSVGFKMHVQLKPSSAARLGASCDLFAFEGGYGALTALGGGRANLCFLMENALVQSLGFSWDALTAHIGKSNWQASHFLDGAKPLAQEFAMSPAVPYGFLRRDPAPAGVFFVGDQMAVIPSLTGEGMTIALMTARRAVDAIIERGVERPVSTPVSEGGFAGGISVAGAFGSGVSSRLRFAIEASRDYQREVRSALRPQLDSAMALHVLFKNPRLVDVTTYALRAFPSLFVRAFRTTRCHLIPTSGRSRLQSWSKPAVAGAHP